MYLLDTDHMSLIHRGGAEGQRIRNRLSTVPREQVSVSIVSYEEQMRGWFAALARARSPALQESIYAEIARALKLYCATPIVTFQGRAVEELERLLRLRLKVGTMDLKIAAIALANDATVLTRNTVDFRCIPGLSIENWAE